MPWGVSVSDVYNTTGASATVAQVAQADAVVTIYVNRTSDASGAMGARDLTWIRQAISWQTAWQLNQPDYASRMQFDSLSQDGMAIEKRAEWTITLAPLAARAIKNLSWKGSRTARTPSVATPLGYPALAFGLETSDAYHPWRPL